MFVVESYALAVVLCVVTMLCWGSWANTQKLAGREWRFELFYWDYAIGVLLLAFLMAFTLGSVGEKGRDFLTDLVQADTMNLLSAVVGGIVFNAANILLVAAIAIAGMSVAFPVGIGIALVLGVFVNYLAAPLGNALFLFLGVFLIAAAILMDAAAYRKIPGQAKGLSTKGLTLSLLCGVLMGFFYGFVANSMSLNFDNLEAGKLSPYTAMVFFSLGLVVSNFLFNTLIMRRPFVISIGDYLLGIGLIAFIIFYMRKKPQE